MTNEKIEYTERNAEAFLGDVGAEIRGSLGEMTDSSLIMVRVEGDMNKAYAQLNEIKESVLPYIAWWKYNSAPVFAMIAPMFGKNEASDLVERINNDEKFKLLGNQTAVSTTYEPANASEDSSRKDAELMVYDLYVNQLGF